MGCAMFGRAHRRSWILDALMPRNPESRGQRRGPSVGFGTL